MTGYATGKRENSPDLLPHQAAFIEQFFADPSKRGHRLQSDVGLGTSYTVVHLIKRALEREAYTRVVLFAPKALLTQMRDMLTSNRVDAEVVDRFRYRELQDAAPMGNAVWSTSKAFLLSLDFARQADIAGSLAAVPWNLVVVLEAHLLRGSREELVRQLLASSPDLRILLIGPPPDVQDLATVRNQSSIVGIAAPVWEMAVAPFGLDDLQKTTWRRTEVLDHAGKRLFVQSTRGLEVIQFQQEPAERQVHEAFQKAAGVVRSTDGSASPLADILLRALSSSPLAAECVVRRLQNRVGHTVAEIADTQNEQDDATDADEINLIPDERNSGLIEVLNDCLIGLESLSADSKLNALVQRLVAWQRRGSLTESICVLTEYRSTLFCLQTELEQVGVHSYLLHGLMNFDERSRTILEFKERGGVLVATSAIATGFALPFLDVLIFYDLPRSSLILRQLLGHFDCFDRTTPLDVKVLFLRDSNDPKSNAMLAQLRWLLVDPPGQWPPSARGKP
jgi:hypothetical protein